MKNSALREIVIAPFSNSWIRDWPIRHYARLVQLLITHREIEAPILIVGTPAQRPAAREMVRMLPPDRAINACGRLEWSELVKRVQGAACVIGNNSGIAHLAGHAGVPVICIFGGSHQRLEWRPSGDDVTVLSIALPCSPCHLDHHGKCPIGKRCLTDINPQIVADVVLQRLRPAATKAERVPTRLSRPGSGA